MASRSGDAGACGLGRAEHCMHTALRMPAEPHMRKGHDEAHQGSHTGREHCSHRLRCRRVCGQPGEPAEADACGGAGELEIGESLYFKEELR